MTTSAISSTSSLDFVAMLGCGQGNSLEFPTWVPNWCGLEESSSRQLNYLLRSKGRGMNISPLDGFLYSAGAGSPVISTDGTMLRAKGFIFDGIDGLSHTMSETDSLLTTASKSTADSEINPYGTDHELLGAITRTLTRYTGTGVLRRRDVVLNLLFDFWTQDPRLSRFMEEVRAWLLTMRSFVVRGTMLQDFARKTLPPPRELTTAANTKSLMDSVDEIYDSRRPSPSQIVQWRVDYLFKLLEAVEAALKDGMRFMATDNGYVGWAHPESEKGDRICVLQGCSVPVILRLRAEGGYVLVGDAYVEGIMKGEAMIGLQDSDWEDIEIY